MKKEIRENQALNSHILNFDYVQKGMTVPTSQSPIDPAAGSKVVMPSPGFSGSGVPFKRVPGVSILENGKAEITFFAPDAKRVEIAGIGGSMQGRYDMEKQDDGYWKIVLDEVRSGFHYCVFIQDGVMTYSPVLPFGFGCSYVMNYFEVPDEDSEFYLLNDVPHGTIHMELLKSESTGRYRNLWVYTPYGYETSGKKYPVMHILHGGGENETGWFWQGKINYIMDNLIAEGKAEEMIIVTNCGYADPADPAKQKTMFSDLSELIKDDCIPFDPSERLKIFDPEDKMKNEGIRMVYKGAKDIRYQNILGLNVLTICI